MERAVRLEQLRDLVGRTAPVTLAHERTLPVLAALESLFPHRCLQRGSVVGVTGSAGATSVALAILAGPTMAGSWAACVGVEALNWSAAAELGVDLDHVVAIKAQPRSWTTVVAALVDAFEVVVCGTDHLPSQTEVRRLESRARERGAVVMVLDSDAIVGGGRPRPGPDIRRRWPDVDVWLSVADTTWTGVGEGWGRLTSRRVSVSAVGRASLSRGRRVDLWLPGPDGDLSLDDISLDDISLDDTAIDTTVQFQRRAG